MNGATTVLLVDDELPIRESIENVMRRDRRVVLLTAESGAHALKILQERRAVEGAEVAVLISDYQMPLMNGLELMEAVRGRYPLVIRILLSARIDLNEVTDAFNRGLIFRFLAKPCPPEEFSAAVHAGVRASQALIQSDNLMRRYEELKAHVEHLGRAVLATSLALRHDSQIAQDGELLLQSLSGANRNG